VSEASKLLKVSRATVYRLVAVGKVTAVRVSHAIRIRLANVAQTSERPAED
jgi:excisionase family DNA binding protein